MIPLSALMVKQYKCCIKLLNLTGVSEYSRTSSYLACACAMLSVSPQPPRGFRARNRLLTETSKLRPLPNGLISAPMDSLRIHSCLSLCLSKMTTCSQAQRPPPHGRLGERSSGWRPCKTQRSLIWIASQPLKQPLHNGDLKRQCRADIAVLGQLCTEITTKCLDPHTKCSCRAVIWRRCQTKKSSSRSTTIFWDDLEA